MLATLRALVAASGMSRVRWVALGMGGLLVDLELVLGARVSPVRPAGLSIIIIIDERDSNLRSL